MREIKFRTWDGKLMNYDPCDCPGDLEVTVINDVFKEDIWMQYTGLKDKNGKKIYESDIVQYLDGKELSTENGYDCIEFDNCGVIFFDNECGRYDVTNKQGLSYDDLFDYGIDFVVLGNIHENPELLPND
jgi:uncharacterized phage protein (TIGR01671 family)